MIFIIGLIMDAWADNNHNQKQQPTAQMVKQNVRLLHGPRAISLYSQYFGGRTAERERHDKTSTC